MSTKSLAYYSPTSSDRSRRDEQPQRKRLRPADVLVRAATAELLREPTSTPDIFGNIANVVARVYGNCPATTAYIERAAVSPANSTTATWAAELVGTAIIDFMGSDMAKSSGFAQLSQRVLTVPAEQGIVTVKIPSRASPLSLMGAWIGESSAKPVFAASLGTTTLQSYKLAGISVFTEEMMAFSAIEQIVREVLAHDLTALLDTALFDATAASSVRPAGLFNGATSVTASVVTPPNEAMIADLKALTAAVTGTGNPDASVVFVCNPAQAVRIGIMAPQYQNVITSGYMAAGSVGAIDVGGVAMIVGTPVFALTSNAALHMSDAPLALGTGVQGSGVLAVPMRSMFQEDAVGLRCVLRAGWVKRRAAATAIATGINW